MSLDLEFVRPLNPRQRSEAISLIAWDGLSGKLQKASLEQIRVAIVWELQGTVRMTVLRKLISRFNALQASENEAELAQEIVNASKKGRLG